MNAHKIGEKCEKRYDAQRDRQHENPRIDAPLRAAIDEKKNADEQRKL